MQKTTLWKVVSIEEYEKLCHKKIKKNMKSFLYQIYKHIIKGNNMNRLLFYKLKILEFII
jgi:hypothetical protein